MTVESSSPWNFIRRTLRVIFLMIIELMIYITLMMKVANVERLAVDMMTICFMPTPAEPKEQREKRENHDACVAYISQEHCQLKKIYYDGHKKEMK